jgi:hypothetical protein
MRDLHRAWQSWTRTEQFSAVIIFAATITVIVPAAIEFTHQTATTTIAPQQLLSQAR